jgi:hypothetical protein
MKRDRDNESDIVDDVTADLVHKRPRHTDNGATDVMDLESSPSCASTLTLIPVLLHSSDLDPIPLTILTNLPREMIKLIDGYLDHLPITKHAFAACTKYIHESLVKTDSSSSDNDDSDDEDGVDKHTLDSIICSELGQYFSKDLLEYVDRHWWQYPNGLYQRPVLKLFYECLRFRSKEGILQFDDISSSNVLYVNIGNTVHAEEILERNRQTFTPLSRKCFRELGRMGDMDLFLHFPSIVGRFNSVLQGIADTDNFELMKQMQILPTEPIPRIVDAPIVWMDGRLQNNTTPTPPDVAEQVIVALIKGGATRSLLHIVPCVSYAQWKKAWTEAISDTLSVDMIRLASMFDSFRPGFKPSVIQLIQRLFTVSYHPEEIDPDDRIDMLLELYQLYPIEVKQYVDEYNNPMISTISRWMASVHVSQLIAPLVSCFTQLFAPLQFETFLYRVLDEIKVSSECIRPFLDLYYEKCKDRPAFRKSVNVICNKLTDSHLTRNPMVEFIQWTIDHLDEMTEVTLPHLAGHFSPNCATLLTAIEQQRVTWSVRPNCHLALLKCAFRNITDFDFNILQHIERLDKIIGPLGENSLDGHDAVTILVRLSYFLVKCYDGNVEVLMPDHLCCLLRVFMYYERRILITTNKNCLGNLLYWVNVIRWFSKCETVVQLLLDEFHQHDNDLTFWLYMVPIQATQQILFVDNLPIPSDVAIAQWETLSWRWTSLECVTFLSIIMKNDLIPCGGHWIHVNMKNTQPLFKGTIRALDDHLLRHLLVYIKSNEPDKYEVKKLLRRLTKTFPDQVFNDIDSNREIIQYLIKSKNDDDDVNDE